MPATRAQRRAQAEPTPLRRMNALRRVALTRAGRRRARALLFEPAGAAVYYYVSSDARTGQAWHHLIAGRDQRVFERAADVPEFAAAL